MPLIIGQCDKEDCNREALEGYDQCAYHRSVEERKKYQNLKDAGMIGKFIIAAGVVGKTAFELGKGALNMYRTFS